MKRNHLVRSIAVCIIGTAALVLVMGATLSPYAIRNWITTGDITAVLLSAVIVATAGVGLLIGYVSRSVWLAILPAVVVTAGIALGLRSVLAPMEGLVLPIALVSSLIFGWIGASIGYLRDKLPSGSDTNTDVS
jgi:hypothetical protein